MSPVQNPLNFPESFDLDSEFVAQTLCLYRVINE